MRYYPRILLLLICIQFILYSCSDSPTKTEPGTGAGDIPAAPDNLLSSVPQLWMVQLNWRENSANEDGFIIERSINSPSSWVQADTVQTNSTSYLDTGLVPGATYYYRVYAYNSAGNSSPSNVTSQVLQSFDPNVMEFNDILVFENNGSGDSPSAIDLLLGRVESAASNNKDAALVDLNDNGTDFYFQSGDLSFLDIISPGYQTQFGVLLEWQSIDQAQWDTLSRIWKSAVNADTLNPNDFSMADTRYPGNEYFGFPLINHSVFSFYLKGKRDNGITPNPVYGMIWLKTTTTIGGLSSFSVQVDIKINIAGQNQFRRIY